MKTKNEKFLIEQINTMKQNIVSRYDIDIDFVSKILDEIINKNDILQTTFNIDNIYNNPLLVHKIILSICLNFEFDKDRLGEITFGNDYINNFVGRIISQTIYSTLNGTSFQLSNYSNHPLMQIIMSISSLIKYRVDNDLKPLKRRFKMDFTPLSVILKEAMESLEGTYLLISNKSYSQAMTVYRLYLEQVITVIALIKNPLLINDYILHQQLTIKYAKDTSDKDVLALIEKKKIAPRDVKSFLNYGWIEGISGFDELLKSRYSIKMMAKLCGLSNIYELYSDSTNYVHMNLLFADIDYVLVINKVIEATYATMLGIIYNYKGMTNYGFVYQNIDLVTELETVLTEFLKIKNTKGESYDVLRLKSA